MIQEVIAGGQTGADQGGLEAGKRSQLVTGGWVPKGWRTDAGPAPWLADYGCKEAATSQYKPRTLLNVRQAHALIWVGRQDSPGGVLTLREAERLQLPICTIDYPTRYWKAAEQAIREFLEMQVDGWILMVAGNRERTNPGIYTFTLEIVEGGLIPF